MSITYATHNTIGLNTKKLSQLVSNWLPPGGSRVAKSLTVSNVTSVAPPQANLGINALYFASGVTPRITLNSVNANWNATSINSTDGGTNGKLWVQNLGQFTFEFWVNFTSTTGQIGIMEFGNGGPAIGEYSSSVGLYFAISGSSYNFTRNWTPSTATWYHVAFTRYYSGSTLNLGMWIGGVWQTSQATTTNFTGTGNPYFGGGGGSVDFKGYLQDIRISNIARYTAGVNFTPPTSPFVNDVNTLLLIHGSSPIADDNT